MIRQNFLRNAIIGICALALFAACADAGIFKPSKSTLRKYLAEHSLVVVKNGKTNFYEGRGIKPLINYLENDNFKNAYIGDKRIGKASALLIVYGDAKEVYTPLISKPAIEVFEKHNIKYTADTVVENIKNNAGTDLCPMEKKVQNINDPKEAYELFKSL